MPELACDGEEVPDWSFFFDDLLESWARSLSVCGAFSKDTGDAAPCRAAVQTAGEELVHTYHSLAKTFHGHVDGAQLRCEMRGLVWGSRRRCGGSRRRSRSKDSERDTGLAENQLGLAAERRAPGLRQMRDGIMAIRQAWSEAQAREEGVLRLRR